MLTFHKKTVLLLLMVLTVCSAMLLHATGQQEESIERAQELINERRYNEAIVILARVMRQEPEKFDLAQELLEKIRSARSEYNQKYEELIQLYKEEELDLEKAYEIFQELEELDKSPSKATVEAFEQARQTAIFVYNNNRFDKIMTRGLDLMNQGRYWEAVTQYLTGMDLYIEEYQQKDYGNIIENQIEAHKEELVALSTEFVETKDRIERLLEQENSQVGQGNIESLNSILDQISDVLLNIARIRKRSLAITQFFENQNKQIQEAGDEQEFHLTFLKLLIKGRSDIEQPEGIYGAVSTVFKNSLTAVEEDVVPEFKSRVANALSLYEEKKLDEARISLEGAQDYALLTLKTLRLWQADMDVQENLGFTAEERTLIETKLPAYNYAEAVAKTTDSYISVIEVLEDSEGFRERIPELDTIEELTSVRQEIVDLSGIVNELNRYWAQELAYYQSVESNGLGGTAAIEAARRITEDISVVEDEVLRTEIASVGRMALLRFRPLSNQFGRYEARTDQGYALLTGYEKTIGEGETENTITVKDSRGSKEIFTSVRAELTDLKDQVSVELERLNNEKDYIKESETIVSQMDEERELISRIDGLLSDLDTYIAQADEQIFLAEKLEREANFRIGQVENALTNNRFDDARAQLREAAQRFYRSLTYQENPSLRQESDQLINSLGEEINTRENNLIVAEVRNLIEEGKQLYTQERYYEAERVFERAQSRWKVTHVENKQEIEYWLGIISVALNVKSGREIDETNPLYPEMSQLINLAREDFLKARELVEQNKPQEADEYFSSAEKKLLYVKIPFPLNREASILSLRIQQYQDLDNFSELFSQKFQEARSKLVSNPQDAYIELKDLEAIKPDYPGLASTIYNAEVRLGIRVPPPDPAKIRESNDLYQKAFAIVQSNVRSQFPIALEYLNRAIKLTPNNQQVTNLLDRIEADLGGRTTTVLASAAQQQYKLAEEKYLEGSYYEALRIVNNLMKDRSSSQYPPLLELKRRIESKI